MVKGIESSQWEAGGNFPATSSETRRSVAEVTSLSFANCRICGKLFYRTTRDICLDCRTDEEGKFLRVKKYLHTYPSATIDDVTLGTEVELSLIILWIEQRKLTLEQNPNIVLECERCGAETRTGRLCPECRSELRQQLVNQDMGETVGEPSPLASANSKVFAKYHLSRRRDGR
jgi:flagellar operon protein (TIGR03826 family)